MLSLNGHEHQPSRCFGHPDCPMTAGYYIGGGHWVCWLHILFIPGAMDFMKTPMKALPSIEQQRAQVNREAKDATDKAKPAKVSKPTLFE